MGYLEKIICEIDKHNISVISFDIYDTLLFRMVRHPERIYDKTYEMNPKMFPDYIDAREWREIRMKAEHIAREKRRNSEITLDDIYSCLPKIIQNINEIKGMEIKCEKKYSYLNKDIVNWIRLLKKEYNKKIVLTSDMYLSKSVITEILIENGLNKKWIDEMFISCDKGETKRSGKLYKIVCDELSCVPENILHIGDNRKSDYIMARTMGVKALYYPIRSEAFIRYPYTCYEVEQYGYIGDDIHTLRFLAAQNVTEQMNEQQRYWFELGAVIMGPILTCSVEWVLDVAQENNIEYIFPMMREGKFLSVLLENAKKERGWKGIIQPMYISRKALYPALLSVLKKKDMEYNLSTHKMTVKGLFSLLSINDSIGKFAEFENYELAKTKDVFIDGESVFVQLSNYLCSQQMIQKIRQENVDADGLLWKYLCELGLDKVNYITFDVGWRGNAQNAIQRILKKKHVNTKGIHLLINGKKFLVQQGNLQDECDIRGYTGNYGKNENYINELIVPIFEMFLMCDEGTTIGYEIVKGNCIPIKKDVFYNEQQMQLIKYVQKGILSFQKKYFELKHQKGDILSIAPEEVLKIAGRLMRYPTRKEAKLIGAMQYDQNFGIDEKWQIINEKKLEEYQLLGYTQFVYQGKNREDEWYYGMDACIDGLQNYKTIMFSKRYIRQYEYCLFVERICKQTEKFVLIGAGDHLCDILAFLNILGETERVEMVCDSNRFLQEIEICGYKIVPLEQKSQSNCFVITAYDKKVINEIKKVLKEIHGEEIVIFHI